jgi:hypothetical protein
VVDGSTGKRGADNLLLDRSGLFNLVETSHPEDVLDNLLRITGIVDIGNADNTDV